jgi:hypothetical protein
MKLSRIQQIIKEEVAKALNEGPYSEKVGNAIKSKAEGKSEKEKIKLISDYLNQDGNTKTEILNLMNDDDFISDVLQIINNKTEGITQTINNKTKNKEYTFEYAYWYGEDDYDFDDVTVKARNEEEARDLAYAEARKEHQSVRTSKEKFELLSVK